MKFFQTQIQGFRSWWRKRSWWMKVVIVVGIVGLGYWGWQTFTSGSQEATTIRYATVETGDITQEVSETGEIMTAGQVAVPSSIQGVVSEVYVSNGDSVKRGDKLFYVTSTATAADRTQAYASYLSAKNNLESAKASEYSLQADLFTKWDTYYSNATSDEYSGENYDKTSLPEFLSPEKEWLASEAKYKNQQAVISQAQTALNSAWLSYQAISDGVVIATSDGVVQNLAVARGQTVDTATTSLVIDNQTGSDWVQVAINEFDIVDVQPGQNVTVGVDAFDGQELSGTVQRIDEFGTNVSDVIVYYVYIELEENEIAVKPGMTVQVSIRTAERNDVLLVPNTAIKPYQGGRAVQVMDQASGQVIYQPITTGVVGDVSSEVIEGLEAGQQIVIEQSSTSSNNSGGGLFSGPRPM